MKKNNRAWRTKRQKREHLAGLLSFFAGLAVLMGLICVVRYAYARLDNVQQEVEKLRDLLQTGRPQIEKETDANADGEKETDADAGGAKKADADADGEKEAGADVGTAEIPDVGKPVERTEEEVFERLCELGRSAPAIKKVCQQAAQYPEELLEALANNPEMADFALCYPNGGPDARAAFTDSEIRQEFPLFLQWDKRWGYEPYGEKSCVGLSGCGPTCLSMALFYLTGDTALTPDKIAAYSMENGYYVEGAGTAWALMEDLPGLLGVSVRSAGLSFENMAAALQDGGVIICAMGRGDFTLEGHYIVIYGYDAAGFSVNDPNCMARSRRKWSYREIKDQIRNIWVYTK